MTEPPETTALEIKPPAHTGRPRKYSPEQIRHGLLTLAKHGGNSVQAATELAENGHPIPDSVLRDWRLNQHPELYTELHATYTREIEARLIPEYRDTAFLAAQVARQAVQASKDDLDAGKVKDPSTMARNLMVTSGTSLDKVLILTERPTVRTENTDVASVLRSLEHLIPGMQPTVDATVVEDQNPTQPAQLEEKREAQGRSVSTSG